MTGLGATLCSGIGALLFGGLLGFATVDGVRPHAAEAAPIYPRAAPFTDPAGTPPADACAACSTYDEGYRWTSLHRIAETDACFGDDWSRQSGCLAYVRASRLD